MESIDYQVLHYEAIADDENNTYAKTAEVLEIINGHPSRIFVVPVIGMEFPADIAKQTKPKANNG